MDKYGHTGWLSALQTGWRRRLPMLRQTEAAECGLACVAMVAGYYGQLVDLPSLRRRFDIPLGGMNLRQLMTIASTLGLNGRAVRLELDELPQLRCPAVLHWDMDHFVVLAKVGRRHVWVHDPATGKRKISLTQCSQHFTGVALELQPTDSFSQEDNRQPVHLRRLMGRVDGLASGLLHVFALSLALQVFVLAGPLLMQWLMDEVLVSLDRELLLLLVIATAGLGLMRTATRFVRSWVITHLATRLNVLWQTRVFEHLLRLPMRYFEKRHVGDVVSRFHSLHDIQETLTTQLVEGLLDGVVALVAFCLMCLYNPLLAILALGFVLLYGLTRWLRFAPVRHAQEAQIVSRAELDSHFLETLRGMQTVKLFAGEGTRRDEWLRRLVLTTNEGLRIRRLDLAFMLLQGVLTTAEQAAVLWLGAQAVLGGSMTVGALLAYLAWKDQFIGGLDALIDKLVNLGMVRLYAERLADIVHTEPEQTDAAPFLGQQLPHRDLSVHGLVFRYGSFLPAVVSQLDLHIRQGEFVAIRGPSGLGKTTLLKLMLGLLQAESGDIRYGGISIRQLGSQYRQRVAAVMQNDQLLSGSLAENIALFDPRLDLARVEHCATLACIHDDIMAMPMGYNTLVGDMGSTLSGGQKQRVLLARALYRQPDILFMDEASSHLDLALEQRINEQLRQLPITRIAVAHRPQTLQMADRIIDLGTPQPADLTQNPLPA